MKQFTVAIAGCGSRGCDAYARSLLLRPESARITALADTEADRVAVLREKCGVPEEMCFDSAEALLARERLADVLVIATPDRAHYRQAMAALEKGYHLLLEKPIACELDECYDIKRLAEEKGLFVLVGHVLRYTKFYQQIKALLDAGAVGEIASMQAIEKVCYWHQAHSFVRGNWRNAGLSSPMILQKCCHDMDILLWLAGKKCVSVSSYGSLMHFRKECAPKGAPLRCTDSCPAAEECPYNAEKYYMGEIRKGNTGWPPNVLTAYPTEETVYEALKTGPYGRCVYHCDNDVVDHQVTNLLLEGGTTASLTMCAFTKEGGRELRVMGTKGELFADMEKNTISVMPFAGECRLIDLNAEKDGFGHGGGDDRLIQALVDVMDGRVESALSAIADSVQSHAVALKAEISRLNGGEVQII